MDPRGSGGLCGEEGSEAGGVIVRLGRQKPLVLSLSKDGLTRSNPGFDKLSPSGLSLTAAIGVSE